MAAKYESTKEYLALISSSLMRNIYELENSIKEAEQRKKFLQQQILNQFLNSDINVCKRILTDPCDIFFSEKFTVAVTNQRITEKFMNNVFSLHPLVFEQSSDSDIRKAWHIDGHVGATTYMIKFYTEFKTDKGVRKEFVQQITNLEFNPLYPVLELMSEAVKRERLVETIIPTLYLFNKLREERSDLISELEDYEEVESTVDDDVVVCNIILSSECLLAVVFDFFYNLPTASIYHKITIRTNNETLIRYSQHRNISVLKGEQLLEMGDVINFIRSLFEEDTEEEGD